MNVPFSDSVQVFDDRDFMLRDNARILLTLPFIALLTYGLVEADQFVDFIAFFVVLVLQLLLTLELRFRAIRDIKAPYFPLDTLPSLFFILFLIGRTMSLEHILAWGTPAAFTAVILLLNIADGRATLNERGVQLIIGWRRAYIKYEDIERAELVQTPQSPLSKLFEVAKPSIRLELKAQAPKLGVPFSRLRSRFLFLFVPKSEAGNFLNSLEWLRRQ